MTAVLYLAACLVIPFAWGIFVHWVFRTAERAAVQRRKGSAVSRPPSPPTEHTSSLWDYNI